MVMSRVIVVAMCMALLIQPSNGIPFTMGWKGIVGGRAEGKGGAMGGVGRLQAVAGGGAEGVAGVGALPATTPAHEPTPKPLDKDMALYLLNHSRTTYCDDEVFPAPFNPRAWRPSPTVAAAAAAYTTYSPIAPPPQKVADWSCPVCRSDNMSWFRPYFVSGEEKRHVFTYGTAPARNPN